ncbi:unnamed protein product [Boreogadus saida]
MKEQTSPPLKPTEPNVQYVNASATRGDTVRSMNRGVFLVSGRRGGTVEHESSISNALVATTTGQTERSILSSRGALGRSLVPAAGPEERGPVWTQEGLR